jgi:hypothetical protein
MIFQRILLLPRILLLLPQKPLLPRILLLLPQPLLLPHKPLILLIRRDAFLVVNPSKGVDVSR